MKRNQYLVRVDGGFDMEVEANSKARAMEIVEDKGYIALGSRKSSEFESLPESDAFGEPSRKIVLAMVSAACSVMRKNGISPHTDRRNPDSFYEEWFKDDEFKVFCARYLIDSYDLKND